MKQDWHPFILYGEGGEFASNKLEDQEMLMLSLPLLQVSKFIGQCRDR